jgi:uridine kinase
MSRERRLLIEQVASMVPTPRADECVRVGVDGVDGVGKTVFAAELGSALRELGRPVVNVSLDGFHHPRSVRYRRGRHSPEGFWLDSYDYLSFSEHVLGPFGPGGSRRYRSAVHDVVTDDPVDSDWQNAPVGAVLVVDGLFVHRDELWGVWDFSVFLHAPFAVTAARLAERDGTHPDPAHPSIARYVEGQRLYFAACAPWRRADLIIDNSDILRPAFTDVPGPSL